MKRYHFWASFISFFAFIIVFGIILFIEIENGDYLNIIIGLASGLIVLFPLEISLFLFFRKQEKIDLKNQLIDLSTAFNQLYRLADYIAKSIKVEIGLITMPGLTKFAEIFEKFNLEIQSISNNIKNNKINDYYNLNTEINYLVNKTREINESHIILHDKLDYLYFLNDVSDFLTSKDTEIDNFIKKANDLD